MNELLFSLEIAKICDYFFPTYGPRYDLQFKNLNKGFENPENIKPYSIIYADLSFFFEFTLFSRIKVPFILVTNDCPVTVPYINYSKIDSVFFQSVLENPNLIKIFSSNVDSDNQKLSCIPIGLPKHIPFIVNEKEKVFMGWFPIAINDDVKDYIKNLNINSKENIVRTYKKLLFCKFTNITNKNPFHKHINVRDKFIQSFRKKNIIVDQENSKWEDYIDDLKNHKFSLCLPGVGIDCFRIWESLTLGVIPIVINSSINILYEDLPVIIINGPDEISEKFLNEQFKIIVENVNNDKYNWKKLSSIYWINKILKTKYEYILQDIENGNYNFS